MASILTLLFEAAALKHDEDRLRIEMRERFRRLLAGLPRPPEVSPRLLRLSQQPELLKPMNAEDLVDAIRLIVTDRTSDLYAELLELIVVVARLGSLSCAVRIGLLVAEELRAS